GAGSDADDAVPEEKSEVEPDEEGSISSAAYDEMTYRDTTDDDVEGSVMDSAPAQDFDLLHEAERLEKRLQFMSTLARLWNIASRCLREAAAMLPHLDATIASWLKHAEHNQRRLRDLLDAVDKHDVPKPGGAFEA